MNTINQQTPGPLLVSPGDPYLMARFQGASRHVAEITGPNRADLIAERDANRRTLAAGFNLLDKTGRALGIDAATLGESLDLVGLIEAARATLASLETVAPTVRRLVQVEAIADFETARARLAAALSTLPPVTP